MLKPVFIDKTPVFIDNDPILTLSINPKTLIKF